MENLDLVVHHLQDLDPDFFGQIVIRIRDGRAVLICEERSIKLDEEPDRRPESTSPMTTQASIGRRRRPSSK